MTLTCSRHSLVMAVALSSCISPLTWGAGAEVPVIAISSQGTSNANSAEANDASVLFYNPAGITRLRGTQVSLPMALVAATTSVKDRGTTRVQDQGQAPDTGPEADCNRYDCMSDPSPEPAMPALAPQPSGILPKVLPIGAFFATTPYDDTVTLGIGIFSPGGGNLNYKSNWFGRHFIDSAAIETININPSLGIRFDDKHSVGLGVSALLGHAKFKLQIDVNKIAPYLLSGVLTDPTPVVQALNDQYGGILPADVLGQVADTLLSAGPDQLRELLGGLLAGQGLTGLDALDPALASVNLLDPDSSASGTVEVFGAGYGWNAGYLYQFSDRTRLGMSYRSASELRLRGKLDWDFSRANTSALGNLLVGNLGELLESYRPDTDARLVFTIPAKFNLGLFTQLNDRTDLMLNYSFNKTSIVKELVVTLPNQRTSLQQGNVYLQQHWRDTFTLAAGMNYRWNDQLVLRTGLQFDQSPVASSRYRHPALADNDRWMGSFGLGYRIDQNTQIDLAYSYLYILPSNSDYHEPCTGTYFENDADQSGNNGSSECTQNGGTFRARFYNSHAHILGLQFNKRY